MAGSKRLSKEERKFEIMMAAEKVFIDKGFSNTTMEDVIAQTSLSKGGVYHYYKNTTEILQDLMLFGIEYRKEKMQSHREEYEAGKEIEFFAKRLVEKALDDNPHMPVYVQFLIEKKRNQKLKEMFEMLKEKTQSEMGSVIKNCPASFHQPESFDLITDFLNAVILACDILESRDQFLSHKNVLEKIFILLLNGEKE